MHSNMSSFDVQKRRRGSILKEKYSVSSRDSSLKNENSPEESEIQLESKLSYCCIDNWIHQLLQDVLKFYLHLLKSYIWVIDDKISVSTFNKLSISRPQETIDDDGESSPPTAVKA